MKISQTHVVALVALVLVGCDQGEPMAATPAQQAAPAPRLATTANAAGVSRVAVFDIDQVAEQTGMMQDMQKKILAKKERLSKDLDDFRKRLQDQLEKEGKKLTKDKDLPNKAAALEQATAVKFRQGQVEADAALNAYRIQLISEIRDAIKPVAREVAFGMGFDILLLSNDMVVFEVREEAELTNEILMAYQARFPDAVKKAE
ncbi:OmpH family outer membrane protein [Magnetovirga frankeli]|uniref:OmpH family outer membrane protein n=1 Tax=Magnetovirga frankeli TaxID=947516 RepID=UPI0012930874|nr:OmpH family outer membrane protein [gamma proteobacterium SS-5]